jgi:hypothetical protein
MSLKFLIPPRELINIINDDYPLFKNVRTRFGVIVLPRPYAKTGDVYCIVRGLYVIKKTFSKKKISFVFQY